ncbi:huntingtin [Anabrus simplex]|uniref:huntingtin n=1 Tax=Anabrus simplex TaxID=316456 RepID=UPI0035A2642B
MATLEKLVKALEGLKILQLTPQLSDDSTLRRKEKITHCLTIADTMCHSGVKGASNFSHLLSIAIEILLQLCDDADSDVRMIADESLNRIIRAMADSNVVKIQVELHKEIKKNGNARTLRAALWRFAELCHMIRPQKGKPYVMNLVPCIIHVTKRTEEPVLETLAAAMPKIFKALGNFTTDNDVKGLLKAFLQNLSSSSAVVRRTAATSILAICVHCRKPHVFISYILNILLDCVVPIREGQSVSTVLGVLGCLRNILPHVATAEGSDDEMRGSFGVKRRYQEAPVAVDRMIQVYELCLHYTNHPDHNVVVAALETLHQLLLSPPADFLPILLSSEGITRSRIQPSEGGDKLTQRSLSQMSVAPSLVPGDESSLLDLEPDPDLKMPSIEKWVGETRSALASMDSFSSPSHDKPSFSCDENEAIRESNIPEEEDEGSYTSVPEDIGSEYSNIKIGKIAEGEDGDGYSEASTATLSTPRRPPGMSVQSSLQSEDSREESGRFSSSPSPTTNQLNVVFQVCDIGSFTDSDVPLVYCARHLASAFLLTGCAGHVMPDRNVRVSIKALALGCIAAIVRLMPSVFLLYLDRNKVLGEDSLEGMVRCQPMSDLLLFADHVDPQLRGITSTVIGSLIKSVLLQNGGGFKQWLEREKCKPGFELGELVSLLLQGLEDKSSVCCRQTLVALSMCLTEFVESVDSSAAIPVLKALPGVVNNSYWLVKVKLVEVVGDLPFITIHYLIGSLDFQEKVLDSVILKLLQDEDARVRHAAAEATLRIVPKLFFPMDYPHQDAVTAKGYCYSNDFLSQLLRPLGDTSNYCSFPYHPNINSLPVPFNVSNCGSEQYQHTIETSLSRIVNLLSQTILMSPSKYLVYGCCEALSMLSVDYLTTLYPRAWNCYLIGKSSNRKNNLKRSSSVPVGTDVSSQASAAGGLLATCLALLTASPISLDLSCQQWLVQLTGNLSSGLSVWSLRPADPIVTGDAETPKHLWSILKDKQLSSAAEQLLVHVVRTLNIFVHVLEESTPSIPTPKPSLPSLPTATSLSPIKRKSKNTADASGESRPRGVSPVKIASEKEDKPEEKRSSRGAAMGFFASSPHYMKIYDIVRSAYTNYKITLDSAASEKFVGLLRTTLETMSQLLEIGTLHEVGRIAEEILSYLRLTVLVEPTATIKCVQQLLKCLFGTNLSSQWEEAEEKRLGASSSVPLVSNAGGFYNLCFQTPYQQLTEYINAPSGKVEKDESSVWMNYLRKRGERKGTSMFKSFSRGADKTSLAAYIRLFEPMVIKALKQYTVTSDVKLQCRVLLLLCQLVQLRVNYCLLDSDQIFIGFVLKQFEFIEEGQIPHAEELIPRIFYFLVHLSYEKNHSKCIIGVPKVIQLCDGLMASGQSPVTHCIPALVPVVEDVFLVRGTSGGSSNADLKELETQRDVLVSMLLRLVEYHQVLDLLSLVLGEHESEERWRRRSRDVMDILLPLLAQGRVRLESRAAQRALHRLLLAAAPSVLRPVDPLLRVLFSEAPHVNSPLVATQRWLGMVLAVLLVLMSHGKEEVVLARLEELELTLPPLGESVDPLNASATLQGWVRLPPEQVMARFLMRVLGVVSSQIYNAVFSPLGSDDWLYLQEQFSHFLLYCIHMFESGSYCRVATAAMEMIQGRGDGIPQCLPVDDINTLFVELAPKCPLLTFEWCYLLGLLSYNSQPFWARILRTHPEHLILKQGPAESHGFGPSPCINLEVVRKGGTILFCDYVCENLSDAEQLTWLLVNHIEEVVRLSREPPVQELIAAVHRNGAASGLLVQAVGSRCQNLVQPSMVVRLLRCLEGVHPSQSGVLLMLLVPRFVAHPQLAPARLAAALACRRAEMLLTLSHDEVASQLSKEDLQALMTSLQTAHLTKKHSGLVGLLTKLGAQCYDIHPPEINPAEIRIINIDKTWFLDQVKMRCCEKNCSGWESAQLLSKLDYEQIVSVLNSPEFNLLVLQDCLKLGTQLTLQAYQDLPEPKASYSEGTNYLEIQQKMATLEAPLYTAARRSLMQQVANIKSLLPRPHQVYSPLNRQASPKEVKYTNRLQQLLSDGVFWDTLFQIAPAVSCYLASLPQLAHGAWPAVPQDACEDLAKFGVLCLEAVHWLISSHQADSGRTPQPRFLELGLTCADAVLCDPNLSAVIGSVNLASWTASAAGSLTMCVMYLLEEETLPTLPAAGLHSALNDPDTVCGAHACHQMAVLVLWLEKTSLQMNRIPKFLASSIKSLIVSLSRMPLVNSYVTIPPDVWSQGWAVELTGPARTTVPPLPVDYLQDIDVLQQLIFRMTLLGWISRQQFEETWMALLSVLSSNQGENSAPEEVAVMVQASCLVVQAITALLVHTLLLPVPGNPNSSRLVHQPREKAITSLSGHQKLKAIHELLCWKLQDQCLSATSTQLQHVFERGNMERINNPHRYGYAQVSLEYLWTATRMLGESNPSIAGDSHRGLVSSKCLEREQCLAASGLDLHSCLHFLLDLYSQWTLPQSSMPLRLVSEAIRSVLAISDMFTEKAQFQWMLATCLELSRLHPLEDEVLHQYLVLGACKAAAVLGPEPEIYERVKKLVENGLKSSFLPARVSALHGVLYLLQAGQYKAGSGEEAVHILPAAIEYIQKHTDNGEGASAHSEEHQLVMWALVFYLLENVEEQMTETDVAPAVLQLVLSLATSHNLPASVHLALLQGFERLVVTRSVGGKVGEQVTKLAVERLKHPNPGMSLPALQLLLSCMYIGKYERQTSGRGETNPQNGKDMDPEQLIQAMEKTSALFDRIKKGYPFEVELLCGVLPNLLTDFFPPSEILTKVIGEFLSPQQPHPRLLAAVVFQVFERACQQSQLSLLQDWVVLSLSNFTQCSPVGMAAWCLTCFFISASTNPWLRAIFPHVQSRIGRIELEDRKLLCIAAADFYHHLTDDQQKQTFVSTFQAAAHQPQTPFSELISCL